MANYATLKAAVQAVVKTNGNKEITGANLQTVLLSIINSVGVGGYIFKGVATPSTSAGTPDENVFYIGATGTYANFGTSITIPVGSIGVFKYNGSWAREQVKLFDGIDAVPTANSTNLITSGGVYDKISETEDYIGNYFSRYTWLNNKSISPSSGNLTNNSDTIASEHFFSVPAGATKVVFKDTKTEDGNIVWYNIGFYDSSKAILSRSTYGPATSWDLPQNTKYVRICLALRNGSGTSIGGDQADYDLEHIIMTFDDTALGIALNNLSMLEPLIPAGKVIQGVENTPQGITWSDGYRNIGNLDISTSTTTKHTSPIAVKAGEMVYLSTGSSATSISMLTEVDSTGAVAYRTLLAGYSGVFEEYYIADRDMYVEVSIYANQLSGTIIKIFSSDNIDLAYNKIQNSEKYVNELEYNAGKILPQYVKWMDFKGMSGGDIVQNIKTISSDVYFDVHGYDKLTFSNSDTSGKVVWYAVTLYDDGKNSFRRDGYTANVEFNITEASYIRLSFGLHEGTSDIGGKQKDYPLKFMAGVLSKNEVSLQYYYDGEKINVVNSVIPILAAKVSGVAALQGAAAYGDLLFWFNGQNNKNGQGQIYDFYGITIVNLRNGGIVQKIALGFDILKHNNAVCFGTSKYSSSDPFPLLYASQENSSARYCCVYRITETENTSAPYAVTMVQVIMFPSSVANITYPNAFIGIDYMIWSGFSTDNLYTYYKTTLPAVSSGDTLNITSVPITDDGTGQSGYAQGYQLSNGTIVKANTNDSGTSIKAVILDSYISSFTTTRTNPYTGNDATTQGGCIIDGTIYQVFGAANNSVLKVINDEVVKSTINLAQFTNFNHEPESTFYYDRMIGVTYNGSGNVVLLNL